MIKKKLNISECRKLNIYSKKEYILRICWSIVRPLFYLSPRNFFSWRVFLLRLFGAKIGKEVNIYPSTIIFMPWNLSIGDYSCIGEWALIYNIGLIEIGNSVTVSHKAHLCSGTHNYTNPSLPLQKKKIELKDYVWICTEAFIGPGCTIGEGSIIGARSVAIKDIGDWLVCAGNPIKVLKKRKIN